MTPGKGSPYDVLQVWFDDGKVVARPGPARDRPAKARGRRR